MTRAVLLAIVAACSAPAPTPTAPPPPRQDPAMLDLVRDLAQYVTARHRTAADVDAALASRHVAGARVALDPEGAPFTIAVPLAPPVAVAELARAFVPYQTGTRAAPGMPWPLIFHDAVTGPAARVSLLVDAAAPLAEVGGARVDRVTLRIDAP